MALSVNIVQRHAATDLWREQRFKVNAQTQGRQTCRWQRFTASHLIASLLVILCYGRGGGVGRGLGVGVGRPVGVPVAVGVAVRVTVGVAVGVDVGVGVGVGVTAPGKG